MTQRLIAALLATTLLAPAAVRADEPVTASAGDKGFGLRSADGAFEFRLKGLLQFDARFFADDAQAFNDTFVLRRLEPSFEFTLGTRAYVKLQPQFAGDAATTSDVFGELRFAPAATLRFGKFKTPLALEYLQASSALSFVERGLPTEVGAGRDFGVQLHGALPPGVSYAIAWLNGAPDGRDAANSDTDNHKEVAARVFFEPLPGLGLGVAATRGTKLGAIASTPAATTATFNNTLPRYRSPGQNTLFTYLGSTTAPTAANTVIAAGTHTRLSPQLTFYRGPFGLLAEHLSSEQEVSINGVAETFEHVAWQAAASWVLTGEDASYKGIRPAAPYASGAPGWGAFEVALRHGVLDVDDAAFPAYADPAVSVSEATTTGVALHWHLDANVRASLDYEATGFEGGAAAGDRRDEKVLFARLQVAF
jgi:phosphate-selective porin OprO/OprP